MSIPNLSSRDRAAMILGASRLRNLGYVYLANSLTKFALGIPGADDDLERALLDIGKERWRELRRELQLGSPDVTDPSSLRPTEPGRYNPKES